VTSANLDLVRSIYSAWERGDYSSAGWADPEIVGVVADGPQPRSWRGLDGLAQALREIREAWVDFRAEPEEFRELDDGRVLVLTRRSGRGKTSGLELGELRTEGAAVFEVHDGKVIRLTIYWDRHRALADVGLAT
jgi:ketosteroid isomerase-like protein